METTLHLLQTATKSVDTILSTTSLKLNCTPMPSEDFNEQMGLSDKIPLVKPYLKKKHAPRKLDTKCLRALDPILTSLLSSDALAGGGDGVFLPRSQSGSQRNLCEAVVQKQTRLNQICLKEGGAVPGLTPCAEAAQLTDPNAKLVEPEQEVQIQSTIDSDERSFQPPASETPVASAASPPCQDDKMNGIYPPESFQGANCLADNDSLVQSGIFQDKSDEASLDLVFELLTQLQYHTQQGDGISVCVDFLQGICVYGNDCPEHHTVLPYHWQIRKTGTPIWQSVSDESQEQLERLYCNPDNEQVRLKYQGRVFALDFSLMRVADVEYDLVRRLSTPPSTNLNSNYHTVWKYYCRDSFGWREYSEPVVRLIEEATCRGLKEVRFVTLQNQYILNIREGFQQNAIFGFRRQIKKRPLFLSTVMLMPYLQTLSGLSLPISPPSGTASSEPLSPTASTSLKMYPETWISMDSFQDFMQVPLSKEDKSYRTVYSLFHKTVSETKFKIMKITRVQNPFLWEKYKRKKEYMSRKLSEMDHMINERHLFHGTSQDVVDGICKHNFDPRVSGKHATMFGQGSYFARKAIYSHNFSKRSPKGVHYMFLAKVLTGKFVVGNASMRRPPPLNANDPSSDLFDSCVDNWIDPQIFVIFNDDQSYPYFIIQYEEVSNTVAI
ncbi:protein mono-ADP-ribosyltransferase TIPARP-like [Acipenser oxyrinchus oxyrinchus]|uniref:Protein mono-ADP-ribosyltransferase TIPARP-like n=1 Tax=Acipenser oxyrinchus oxyrinchus TaxID=40147 RepID=A0AAD8D3E9_ACIOX|nr:protein mono-ADP-ribosyltransferase TIPARP-like [Acipenser oxyrinchus oxyrinchus]